MDAHGLFDAARSAKGEIACIEREIEADRAGMPRSQRFDAPLVRHAGNRSPLDAVDAKIDREAQLRDGVLARLNATVSLARRVLDEVFARQSIECALVVKKHWMDGLTWERVAEEMGYRSRDRACRKAQAAFGWVDLRWEFAEGKDGRPVAVEIGG